MLFWSIQMHDIADPIDTVQISESLIRRFDRSGPRYTSYPTADRFVDNFSTQHYITALEIRQQVVSLPDYSVYIHVPFCQSLCYFCACNKIITQDRSRSAAYVDTVLQELQLLEPYLGTNRLTGQLHLGGGTPTFLAPTDLEKLLKNLRQHFDFNTQAELGIEIDPRTLQENSLDFLADLGFNRTSFGVQDFHPEVQSAINRIQPYAMVEQAMSLARKAGFQSINTDLIYGLPKQTVQTFEQTIKALVALRPDRIALYNYAHLPQRFKAQRLIQAEDLPKAEERLQIFLMAAQQLLDAGYEYIGLDHFALPTDELNLARLDQSLHRNFQGYTTRAASDLVGLGVSAIGKVGRTHIQNHRSLKDYTAQITQGQLATFRGYVMTDEDRLREDLIMTLMCSMPIDFHTIEQRYGVNFQSKFAAELTALQPYIEAGLLQRTADYLQVTAKGRLFVRAISMEFDSHLRQATQATYSKLI